MNYLLNQIGYFGPMTLLLLILFMFSTTAQPYNIYLYIYVIAWQVFNHFSNIVIKNTLKQPRPDSGENKDFKLLTPTMYNYFSIHRKFGMPSGHAQSTGYSITFLYLVAHSPALLILSVFIGSLTIYQRFKYRRHTIPQLILGLSVGSLFAIISYKVAQVLITRQTLNIHI